MAESSVLQITGDEMTEDSTQIASAGGISPGASGTQDGLQEHVKTLSRLSIALDEYFALRTIGSLK
jgi:hypothetical protein